MGFDREKHLAGSPKDRGLDNNVAKQLLDEYQAAKPGKRTLIEQQLTEGLAGGAGSWFAVGRRTLVDQDGQSPAPAPRASMMYPAVSPSSGPRSAFDDFRSRGLHDVLAALTSMRGGRCLVEATLSAARKATRSALPSLTMRPAPPDPVGPAMLRVAERRAATLYRRAVDSADVKAEDPAVEAALVRAGGGQPLPAAVRRKMELELGSSLDRVRIHIDSVAAAAARAVHANAFTVGEDIFFADGAYAPETSAGQKLLAHELTHVVQSYEGRADAGKAGIKVSNSNESLEREAEAVADRLAAALATTDPAIAVTAQLHAGGAAASLAVQMRRTFGAAAGDVAITTDSTRPLAAGAEGVAVGEQVYIAPGFYDLTTTAGRERLGHEVAHVLQQRRGRDLSGRLSGGERAGLEAEADRAGRAFARGEPFAVQGRAPAQVALFKGARAAKVPAATITTIDLKAGGRIERKLPASALDAAARNKPKAKEQLIVTYGDVQVSNPFTIQRDKNGEAVRLVGRGTLSLPASKYMKKLDLVISLGADGYIGAQMRGSGSSMIKIGGLTVRGGTLTAAINHGQLTYALDGATIALPRNIGKGALSIDGNGDQEPAFEASLTINVPKLQPSTMSFHANASGYRAEGSTGVDIDKVSGSVTFGLEKVGDNKALWSAAGSVGYNSERLSGQMSVQYNADGELSGEGDLDFKIADFLTGKASVALDKEGHVTVNGEIRPPAETQLFPEKKLEQTFFHQRDEFQIWGISIPRVGSVGIIASIVGSVGYRVGVGAGVMRDIVLSGSYSTDPSVQPTFQITGEIFIPAYAELLISIGGNVKLDAFIAEVGGGLGIVGRAGLYGGLSIRPTLAYEGGQYRLMGQAIIGGDVGLSAQVDAFVRLHVGKWIFSWDKEWDWKLGEWNKWLGLNLGMEADLDYTLGQPLSPDIFKLKRPDSLDVQGIAKSAMPRSGMPPQGPKGAQNQRAEFKQKDGVGAAAPASASAPPKLAGTPAGAVGHRNQDPKGKKVKPAKPPKSGPPKPAKGKNANQTGPNPENKSKPSEQKLDATPIIEPFSMHGEPHQLIVQLGPAGHVDMASKRERLSVKVGHAVAKLTAKHAPPEQISDLKEIGALAKKGDKMVATAKLTDKEGTAKAAQQIAKYGDKWQVHDLDEVAIIGFVIERARAPLASTGVGRNPPGANQRAADDGEIGKHLGFTAAGESHTLWVDTSGSTPIVMMASTPRPLQHHLTALRSRWDQLAAANPEIGVQTDALFGRVEALQQTAVQRAQAAKRHRVGSQERRMRDRQVEETQDALKVVLIQLLRLLGIEVPRKVTPPVRIQFSYHRHLPVSPTAEDRLAGFTREDFNRQLAGQQRGLNAMTVTEWKRNRRAYNRRRQTFNNGRDLASGKQQAMFRERQRILLVQALCLPERTRRNVRGLAPGSRRFVESLFARFPQCRSAGFQEETARRRVDDWLSTQAALHNPDQIAGGHPERLRDLGNQRINFSLGPQWNQPAPAEGRTRVQQLDAGINEALRYIPRLLWNSIRMNVRLVAA